MYYANVQKILDYELNTEDMEKICGKDYLMRKQKSVIKRICEYEDSIINIDYSLLNNPDIYSIIKNSALIIYVHIDKDKYICEIDKEKITNNLKMISTDLYEDRSAILKSIADININYIDDENQLYEQIAIELMNYFKR